MNPEGPKFKSYQKAILAHPQRAQQIALLFLLEKVELFDLGNREFSIFISAFFEAVIF